jgi:hypothetical protein
MLKPLNYLLISILFACCMACKKTTTPTPMPPPPVSSGFYGYINLSDFIWQQHSSVILSGNATAEFNDVMYNNDVADAAPKDAGNVILNGVQLEKNYGFFATDYRDSTHTIFTSPFTLTTTGSSSISSFTLSNSSPFPSFNNFSQLTDTLVKLQGFNFTLTNVADADSLFAFIQPLPYYKHIAINGQSSVTVNFTASELAVLDLSNDKIINFHLYKYEMAYQSNKPYKVTLLKGYSKDVFIKN